MELGVESWSLRGNTLIINEGGAFTLPSARAVLVAWQAGRLPLPIGSIVRMSRYPADVRLDFSVKNGPAEPITCSITASAKDSLGELEPFASELPDHVVLGDTWYPLAASDLAEIKELLATQRITLGGPVSLQQYAAVIRACPQYLIGREVSAESIAVSLAAAPQVPIAGLTLYPYQTAGVQWLDFACKHGKGGLLGDEMGLGKTVQAIALIVRRAGVNCGFPTLVVAPSSILENWRRELARHAPHLDVMVHHGGARTGLPSVLGAAHVVLTSYDLVVRDRVLFQRIHWDLIIADEAQAVKNPRALRTIAIKRLNRNCSVAVTGTPMENRLLDLWSLSDFVVPDYLGSSSEFEHDQDDGDQAARVGRLIRPLLLRRKVDDVAKDLPPRIEIPQMLQMGESEAGGYDVIRLSVTADGASGPQLRQLVRLRQYCAHPALAALPPWEEQSNTAKLDRVRELLEEIAASCEKCLIFASFTRAIDLLERRISSWMGIDSWIIDGRTQVRERQSIVDAFGGTKEPAVLLLNPKAAGTGLNITAANHVIHLTPEWNPAVIDQASARAHRRGQERPVFIYRLLYAGTVEEVMDQRLERKRALASTSVSGSAGTTDDYKDFMEAITISSRGSAEDGS
jgi:SNF2 family DNA or RNA helicase